MTRALPPISLSVVGNLLASASGTLDTIRPALSHHVKNAVFESRKVCDCFFKSVWRLNFHELSVLENIGPVNYIYTLVYQKVLAHYYRAARVSKRLIARIPRNYETNPKPPKPAWQQA
jgi:hypothetical protein